jgi:hypothetical protein
MNFKTIFKFFEEPKTRKQYFLYMENTEYSYHTIRNWFTFLVRFDLIIKNNDGLYILNKKEITKYLKKGEQHNDC